MDDTEFIKKRFSELYHRADERSYTVFSDFLNLNEQSILASLALPCKLYGGYDNAQRVVAAFGDADSDDFPIVCLRVSSVNERFADELTHRDYLGALMNLGIKRELLGDIITDGGSAYIFCLDRIADFIADGLTRVKHTTVQVSRTEPESVPVREPEKCELIVASARLDALVGAVFRLSRSEASRLIASGRVYVNSRLCQNGSYAVREGELISVRGRGRFIYYETVRRTKKDRCVALVGLFK